MRVKKQKNHCRIIGASTAKDTTTNLSSSESNPRTEPGPVATTPAGSSTLALLNLSHTITANSGDGVSTSTSTYQLPYTVQLCPPPLNEVQVEGRRIVSIGHFITEIRRLERHDCPKDTCGTFQFLRERRQGLCSWFTFVCSHCKEERTIATEDSKQSNINEAAAVGALCTGNGFSSIEEMFSILNIPCMSPTTFSKYEEIIGFKWEDILLSEMVAAGKEEHRLACESGNYTEDGVPCITVVVDGGWAHRSYGHRYTSSGGVAVIIGARTKKILYLSVRNKYCSACHFYGSKNESPRNHACFKNWDGPSTAMEADIIAEGFRKSREMHGLEYRKVVGDGDSSVEKALKTSVDYGRMVTKVACVNHVIKNYTKSLYDLRNSGGSHAKHLTNAKIGRLTAAAKGAISASGVLKLTANELASNLRNGPKHVFGTHENCSPHYCHQRHQQSPATFEDLPYTLQTDLMRTANHLADKAPSLTENATSNLAENYMSVVSKFSGGKRVNHERRGSYKRRCLGAGISYNGGKGLMASPSGNSVYLKRYLRKVRRKRLAAATSKASRSTPRWKPGMNLLRGDKHYGPNAEQPQQEVSEEEYQAKVQRKLDMLQVTAPQQHELERATVGQSENERWALERRDRLTASMFGKVCKRLPTTLCNKLVHRLLYASPIITPAMRRGQENEPKAVLEYEEKTQNVVERCGLFVDFEHGYLAASPDGLIGDDGLIEVKCPDGDKTLLEMSKTRKNFCLQAGSDSKLHLKKRHDYFYQIQGQLNISKRRYCVLFVWTSGDNHMEVIQRDEEFWKKEMLPQLIFFYNECLLPEMIDPRVPRGLEIREPTRILQAIRQKQGRMLGKADSEKAKIPTTGSS